jgi:hypothetical protein
MNSAGFEIVKRQDGRPEPDLAAEKGVEVAGVCFLDFDSWPGI